MFGSIQYPLLIGIRLCSWHFYADTGYWILDFGYPPIFVCIYCFSFSPISDLISGHIHSIWHPMISVHVLLVAISVILFDTRHCNNICPISNIQYCHQYTQLWISDFGISDRQSLFSTNNISYIIYIICLSHSFFAAGCLCIMGHIWVSC